MDRSLQPVPVGVPGELHISGESLARGYLRRPELAAEKFIPNPFSLRLQPSTLRLYKTGDLVRYLPDGNIEFLGRIDHQVKIRGNRIELGEIETTLLQHPAVRETVCVATTAPNATKRLVAYVVATKNSPAFVEELRALVQAKLPEYMTPSAFVFLDALPLTPNGKVDRQALPAPEQAQMESKENFVAPRTPLEKTLVEIWAEVLGAKKIGVHDNFFELGGDSILTIQIISRASRAGVKITPKQLFTYPTIAELAEVVETAQVAEDEQGLISGVSPLTPIQHWFFAQNFATPEHWNMAMLLEVSPAMELPILEKAVRQLLDHHDALRLRFSSTATGWQAQHAAGDNFAPVSRFDLSAFPDDEQSTALRARAAELQAGLNLSQGPLLRFGLFDLGPKQAQRLLIVIHHLVVDGVSWRILLEDLATAYRQISAGEKISLPAKTTAFKHWAQRLAEHAQSEKLNAELDYWLKQPAASFHLPVDFAEGLEKNTIGSARTVSVALNATETQALLQETPKAYHTQIDDILLTALLQAFADWTGESSLLVNLEGHGREDILEGVDLSRTVGWFTTMYPVWLHLAAAGRGEALKGIKEQLRRIPQRGIGYGLLRYLSRNQSVQEKLRALPTPEVSFNYLGQFDQSLTQTGLFKIVADETGPVCNPRAKRQHRLDITAMVMQDCLQIEWMYSKHLHRQTTIENLAQNFVKTLRALIEHCQNVEAAGYTPSDFPGAKLNQQALDKLMGKIRQSALK